jgi:hypothetical protein
MTRVERRGFIVGTLGLLAAPLAVEAEQVGKVYRIGFLRAGEPLIDAQGRRRPPLACWACGREVAPMRFRADDLRRQGWASQQTLQIPDGCGCSTEYLPVPAGDGWWQLVPIWEPDQTVTPLRRYAPPEPR